MVCFALVCPSPSRNWELWVASVQVMLIVLACRASPNQEMFICCKEITKTVSISFLTCNFVQNFWINGLVSLPTLQVFLAEWVHFYNLLRERFAQRTALGNRSLGLVAADRFGLTKLQGKQIGKVGDRKSEWLALDITSLEQQMVFGSPPRFHNWIYFWVDLHWIA